MGIKGDKMTQSAALAAEELVSKLLPIGGISSKKMFGGHGIFHNGKMFGIVNSEGRCYFKVNDETKVDYESKGEHQHGKMPYYSIPDSVLSNIDNIIVWANKSIEISK